jgi:hypothetical protein
LPNFVAACESPVSPDPLTLPILYILFMKKTLLLVLVLCAGLLAVAQNAKPTNTIPRAPEVKTLTVAKEATITGYESTIAAGRLSLAKVMTQTDGPYFKTGYTLTLFADNSFNNRKPVKIGLSRKSFDSVFTRGSAEMNSKYPLLNKYVSDYKISLDEEKGWIAVIKYFNSL